MLEIYDERNAMQLRMDHLIDKMTDRFIDDEINKAAEQNLKALERELRKQRPLLDGVHDA